MKNILKKIWNIYKKNEEMINYLFVGGLTFVVNVLCKNILLFTVLSAKNPLELQASIIISWVVAVAIAYVLNRLFVFKSEEKNIIKELFKFVSARIVTLFIEMGLMWFFVTLLSLNSDMWVFIFTIVVQAIVIALNYVFSKLFIFKKR